MPSHAFLNTKAQQIQVGDRVLLRDKDKVHLTKPLRSEGRTTTHHGIFHHGDIIGKQSRDIVKSHKGTALRVYLPTLAEYVAMIPRIVTPVYPADANLMVSLLDIHVTAEPLGYGNAMLEILEAGTGQGALTLYLARAIHGANLGFKKRGSNSPPLLESEPSDAVRGNTLGETHRQAIIHTVDVSPTNSQHAKQIVNGFRQGIYASDVEFHVGDVSQWVTQQSQQRSLESAEDKTFLSHIILDMPDANKHLATAASALHTDGNLLVFNPSISQIMDVVDTVKREYLPLQLDTVLELGQGLTGGKEWDVRSIVPRAVLRARSEGKAEGSEEDGITNRNEVCEDNKGSWNRDSSGGREFEPVQKRVDRPQMVCRPKVGVIVRGGGFVSVWKKMKNKD
ncbi:MAG: hypothetical protein Q9163_000029 [Psora crenata]